MAIKDQSNTIFDNGDQISIGGTATAVTESNHHSTSFTAGYDTQWKAYGQRELGDGVFTADDIWKGPVYGFNSGGFTNNNNYAHRVDIDWLATGAFIGYVSWSGVSNFGSMSDQTYTYYFPSTTNFRIDACVWGNNTGTGTFINDQNFLAISFDSTTTTGGNPIPNDRDKFYAIRITPPSTLSGSQATTWFRHNAEHSGSNSNDTTVWWWHPTDTEMGYLGQASYNITGYTLEIIKSEEEYFDGLAKQFGNKNTTASDFPAGNDSFANDYRRNVMPVHEVNAFDRLVTEYGTLNSDINHVLSSSSSQANMSDFFGAQSYKRGNRDDNPVLEINPSTSNVSGQEANWNNSSVDWTPNSALSTPTTNVAKADLNINIKLTRPLDSTDGSDGGTIKVYVSATELQQNGTQTSTGSSGSGAGGQTPVFTLFTAGDDRVTYYWRITTGTVTGVTNGTASSTKVEKITGAGSGSLTYSTYSFGTWQEFDETNVAPGDGRFHLQAMVTLNQSNQNTTGSAAVNIQNPKLEIKGVHDVYGTRTISLNGIYGTSYNRQTTWAVNASKT